MRRSRNNEFVVSVEVLKGRDVYSRDRFLFTSKDDYEDFVSEVSGRWRKVERKKFPLGDDPEGAEVIWDPKDGFEMVIAIPAGKLNPLY